jgi:HTH-type transcriptional regulator / antitoxin HipB
MEYRLAIAQQLPSLLRSIRKKNRITQQQLGERLGLSQRMVAKLEAHPEKASFERVLHALSALEIDLVLKERKTSGLPSSRNDSMKNPEGDAW